MLSHTRDLPPNRPDLVLQLLLGDGLTRCSTQLVKEPCRRPTVLLHDLIMGQGATGIRRGHLQGHAWQEPWFFPQCFESNEGDEGDEGNKGHKLI